MKQNWQDLPEKTSSDQNQYRSELQFTRTCSHNKLCAVSWYFGKSECNHPDKCYLSSAFPVQLVKSCIFLYLPFRIYYYYILYLISIDLSCFIEKLPSCVRNCAYHVQFSTERVISFTFSVHLKGMFILKAAYYIKLTNSFCFKGKETRSETCKKWLCSWFLFFQICWKLLTIILAKIPTKIR